jgi:hypothetical protein
MADLIEQTDKCANPACHCLVSAGNQFCGERCARMENDLETGDCRCEHAECCREEIP